MIHCPHTEILTTFHTRIEYKDAIKNAIQTMGRTSPADTSERIPLLPLGDVDPFLIHPFLASTDPLTTPNSIQIQSVVLPQYNLRKTDGLVCTNTRLLYIFTIATRLITGSVSVSQTPSRTDIINVQYSTQCI